MRASLRNIKDKDEERKKPESENFSIQGNLHPDDSFNQEELN